ncbi:uncharacterized protein [Hetaerina americana]|uniref:uncharacterized protein n=1 Tax=Hetaerina americana TaxID=62018 RepID=UPI003A7F2024
MLSGHGCYRAYLYKFKHEESPKCPSCVGVDENAEHVFFKCPRYNEARKELEMTIKQSITPESLTEVMMSSKEAWRAVDIFASKVLKDLRIKEQERKQNADRRKKNEDGRKKNEDRI